MHVSLYAIDRLSTWTGKAFSWCILVLTLATVYEVVSRYVFNHPTVWAFDMSVQMYGALFMMAGAYTLSRGGHVRGDVIHRLLPHKWQGIVDLSLYILFFFPGAIALIVSGAYYAADSWSYREYSWNSPAQIQIYFFKTIIPVAGVLMFLQGISESVRCIRCIKTGVWPARPADIEETEVMLMNEAQDLHDIEHDAEAVELEKQGAKK